MKFLGQHFLKNKLVLEEIVVALKLAKGGSVGDATIEIGPGHGELTEYLLRGVRNSRGTHEGGSTKIMAIEKDRHLAELLRNKFSGEIKNGELEILEGDALKILPEFAEKASRHTTIAPWKLVGNIPYYITGKLLRTVGELAHKPERTIFMIQREVAERMCATSPEMNRLAASVQFWANAEIIAIAPKKDFSPAPEVDSAVVLLKTKTDAAPLTPDRYYKAVRTIFAQPRKTILNNLSVKSVVGEKNRPEIENFIKKIGLDPSARPQNLSIDDILALARELF